ncbi:dihydroneopterin aldolase [uncultured Prevotella sp.]|uniref:dihydroneopterin aldolase n=1 Tax=uncultured Prevotella sp. TaxID=159272 RepID=UPI002636FA94|nr:dihydroneopterin aldolase [uncultured Prevotella sp.]
MKTLTESYVHIDGIRLHARHGVLPQEQLTGNDYIINVRASYDISRAMQTDDVVDTLNYAEVYNIIKEEMSVPSKLIEHVAGRIADRLMDSYSQISSVMLRITKCNPPMGADCNGAGVEILVKRTE